MEFHEKVSKLIDLRGFTKAKVARDAEISHSALSAMCRGDRRPYMDQAFKLAKALSVHLDYLADDELGWPPPSWDDVLLDPEEVLRPDITNRLLRNRLSETKEDILLLQRYIRDLLRNYYGEVDSSSVDTKE